MTDSPYLTAAEASELRAHLMEIHRELLAEVLVIPPDIWAVRPDPSAWSPSEMVEHILLTEAALLKRVHEHKTDAPSSEWQEVQGKKAFLFDVLPSQGKAKAGPVVSTFRGLEQNRVETALSDSRAAIDQILRETAGVPWKAVLWPHAVFGSLSGYLWLLYVPLHTERHVRQLKRRREA